MDKTNKILSLVPYKILPPDMGGQKGIAYFNRYLCKHTHLICVTIKDNRSNQQEGYEVKNILSNHTTRYINLFYYFTLSRISRQEKITHLVVEHPYYGWLGILLKWFRNIKLVVHSHNIESLRFKTMGKWWWGILWHYEKWVHRQADHSFFIQDEDRDYAIAHFGLHPEHCTTITYGFEKNELPSADEKIEARKLVCKTHHIRETDKILLFNGTLGYKPNLDAVDTILEKINPVLLAAEGFAYKIIICGNKLPASYNGLYDHREKHIIYAGFVNDINLYFKGCDIFINPVIDGGGIKTKLVEALGYDLSVVSSRTGAIGIPSEVTGGKMVIVEDGDWTAFSDRIMELQTTIHTAPAFFEHFYWDNIAQKAAAVLNW